MRALNRKKMFPVEIMCDTRKVDEDFWRAARKNSIGGSDISKIAGYSNYGSAFTVFMEKKERVEEFTGNYHTIFGQRMEQQIREWFQEDFPAVEEVDLTVYTYPFMMKSKQYEFATANIDGIALIRDDFIYDEDVIKKERFIIPAGELVGMEIKTGSEFLKSMWEGEEIPDEYYCQCQWYMGVTGLKYFFIVYLLGKELKWKVVPRNDQDIQNLFALGEDFYYNFLQKDIEPDSIGLKCETKLFDHDEFEPTESIIRDGLIEEYKTLGEEIKDLEQRREKVKQDIYKEGGNSKLISDGIFKFNRFKVTKASIKTKVLKDKYPEVYEQVFSKETTYTNQRISEVK